MGVKICPKCGGKVSESRNECIHCGYVFPATKKCPDCGADVDEKLTECPECGYYFEKKEEPITRPEEKKTEEQHTKDHASNTLTNVVCSSCGSNDCEKLDDFTYRCHNCQTIIKLKKPDVKVYNINSFAGNAKTEDVPVYQLVKDLDEEEFERNVIIYLAKHKKVSPLFLRNFKIDKSLVSLAYLTFVEKEYNVDISYSCEIGVDYDVKYYDAYGNEKTKKETEWKPFSGTGTDGGLALYCAFGDETKIEAFRPYFYKNDYQSSQFEEFKESDKYPLKRRADKSCDEHEKAARLYDLEASCRSNLPGDHNRNFRSNGRCSLSEVRTYYYVPSYSLIAASDGHQAIFACVANKKGTIFHVFAESEGVANQGDETMPDDRKAKKEFGKTSFGKVSLACLIVSPLLIVLSVIFATVFANGYIMIGIPLYLAALIAVIVCRKKTIDKILDNLSEAFKQRKVEACSQCLADNNLPPLTNKESEEILW